MAQGYKIRVAHIIFAIRCIPIVAVIPQEGRCLLWQNIYFIRETLSFILGKHCHESEGFSVLGPCFVTYNISLDQLKLIVQKVFACRSSQLFDLPFLNGFDSIA